MIVPLKPPFIRDFNVANPMGKTSVKPNAESYIMNPVLAFGGMNNHSKK
jgi:hypothetical protein